MFVCLLLLLLLFCSWCGPYMGHDGSRDRTRGWVVQKCRMRVAIFVVAQYAALRSLALDLEYFSDVLEWPCAVDRMYNPVTHLGDVILEGPCSLTRRSVQWLTYLGDVILEWPCSLTGRSVQWLTYLGDVILEWPCSLTRRSVQWLTYLGDCVPEGRPGIFDIFPLSRISALSFDSPFLSPPLFFCLVILLFYLVIPPPPEHIPHSFR